MREGKEKREETMQHILTTCELWFELLESTSLGSIVSCQDELSFADWWRRSSKRLETTKRKGIDTAVMLGALTLWAHRNKCVFEGAAPSLVLDQHFFDEMKCWCLAGARKLQSLRAP